MARFSILVGLLLITGSAHGQSARSTTFSFLQIEPSARAAAMGGSYNAVFGDDVNVLFYNPALLNDRMEGVFSASYLNHLTDLNAGFVAYAREVPGIGMMAAGVRFLSYGSFDAIDSEGNDTGSFGAYSSALSIGVSSTYGTGLRYGLTGHLIGARIEDEGATAVALDAGVAYVIPAQRLTFSASLNNLGRTLQSVGATHDDLPTDLRLSVSKRLANLPLLFSVTGFELNRPGERAPGESAFGDVMHHLALGGEFQFSEAFQVRFGYNHRKSEDLRMKSRLDLAGTSVGFGLRVSRVNVDYGYNNWSSLGGLHQFTVRTRI
jgi:hypothetical protein